MKRQLTRCVRVSAGDSKTLSANEVSRQRFRSRYPISPVQSPFHCLEAVYSQIRGVPCISISPQAEEVVSSEEPVTIKDGLRQDLFSGGQISSVQSIYILLNIDRLFQ